MISFIQIINRIKSQCPTFQNRVGASVAFQAAIQNSVDIQTPHCFVMPKEFKDFSLVDYDVSFPESLKIKVTKETFSTIICIDNSLNRGAKDGGTNSIIPLDLLSQLQAELEVAFTGWKPNNLESNAGELNLSAGEYVDSDNKFLWYVFDWSILYRRGSGGLTTEQQAQINSIVYGDEVLGTLNRVLVRNTLTQDLTFDSNIILLDNDSITWGIPHKLQQVANIDLENGDYPSGNPPVQARSDALEAADLDSDNIPDHLLNDAQLLVDGDILQSVKDGVPDPTEREGLGINAD